MAETQLLIDIEKRREQAVKARLMANTLSGNVAQKNLFAYADELDKEVEKLLAQLAVLKQQAAEVSPDSEQPIAALKPPHPEPET